MIKKQILWTRRKVGDVIQLDSNVAFDYQVTFSLRSLENQVWRKILQTGDKKY